MKLFWGVAVLAIPGISRPLERSILSCSRQRLAVLTGRAVYSSVEGQATIYLAGR